jgi:Zn-finger nucleic acid-binding protein
MMTLCPYCGHRLSHPIKDGITGCTNCRRVFDTTQFNRLLSLAWVARKQDIADPDWLVHRHGATIEEAEFVVEYVADGCYSHEEFYKLLLESRYAEDPQIRLDRAS